MTTATTETLQRRAWSVAAALADGPPAERSDERVRDAAAYLRCQVILWGHRRQVAALDAWLGLVGDGSKTANSARYKKFPVAVQSAADILRGTESDQLLAAGYREPEADAPAASSEAWECPGCHRLFIYPGFQHESCDTPATISITGHEPVDGPTAASPRVFSSKLSEDDEAHLEAVFGPRVRLLPDTPQTPGPAADPADTPPPVPGEEGSPAGPGQQDESSDEDEAHEPALDEAHSDGPGMTGIGIGPVRVHGRLDDKTREACLGWLARMWDRLGLEKWQLLEGWAHSSLRAKRREELFGAYRQAQLAADALYRGEMRWQDWDEGLVTPGRDPHGVAVELSAEHAKQELFPLMHGTGAE